MPPARAATLAGRGLYQIGKTAITTQAARKTALQAEKLLANTMGEEFIFEMMEHYVVLSKGNMNKKFTVEVCSDLDYEEMVADVSYENHTVATITQENGIDNMEIEIFFPTETSTWTFPLNDFIETIVFAKKCLIEMQKLPEK